RSLAAESSRIGNPRGAPVGASLRPRTAYCVGPELSCRHATTELPCASVARPGSSSVPLPEKMSNGVPVEPFGRAAIRGAVTPLPDQSGTSAAKVLLGRTRRAPSLKLPEVSFTQVTV